MSLSKVSPIENTGAPKLPLEIIGKIMEMFDDDERLEFMKKSRLISPRFYKGVQDSFRDEYFHKFYSHFDGSQQTFVASRTFGYNIFGDYKLNFSTVRISNSEYYLHKTMLKRIMVDNLQTLELKDNRLNWKEVIMVLGKFPKITNLKIIESPKVGKRFFEGRKINPLCSQNMFEIFQKDYEFYGQEAFRSAIQDEVDKNQNFLANLKSFKVDIFHMLVMNTMSMIVSCSECQLENFSLKFNVKGGSKLMDLQQSSIWNVNRWSRWETMCWEPIDIVVSHFEKYSESMKRIELCTTLDNIFGDVPAKFFLLMMCTECIKYYLSNFLKPEMFKKLESLIIKVPSIEVINETLKLFIKSHENLTYLYISTIDGVTFVPNFVNNLDEDPDAEDIVYNYNEETYHNEVATFQNHLKNYMVSDNNTRFEYESIYFEYWPLVPFSENVVALTINKHRLNNFNFSDQSCPIFQNCREIKFEANKNFELVENIVVPIPITGLITKCPNLTKLIFFSVCIPGGVNFNFPQFSNADLQLIIGHYVKLTVLHLEKCVNNLSDTGITGLTEDAIQLRLEDPDLPIEPQEITGLPISHLKKLETLVIKSETPLPQITDLSAKYGFIGMKKLKKLKLVNTNITPEGFEILKDKTGSNKLAIFLEYEYIQTS